MEENLKKISSLQFITQETTIYTHASIAKKACEAGVDWVQLRVKGEDDFVLEKEAVETSEICKEFGAIFIVNDYVELARRVNADGVHLGKADMSILEARKILGDKKIIGATANTFADVVEAYNAGANYVGLGPFKHTTTKKKLSPVLGIEGYAELLMRCREKAIHIPIVAVGGIGLKDIAQLKQVGINKVAVSGVIAQAKFPDRAVKELKVNLENKTYVRNSG